MWIEQSAPVHAKNILHYHGAHHVRFADASLPTDVDVAESVAKADAESFSTVSMVSLAKVGDRIGGEFGHNPILPSCVCGRQEAHRAARGKLSVLPLSTMKKASELDSLACATLAVPLMVKQLQFS